MIEKAIVAAIVICSMIISGAITAVLSILVIKIRNSCNHSYERVDTCNDKKMILVCDKCGKIKKLRK